MAEDSFVCVRRWSLGSIVRWNHAPFLSIKACSTEPLMHVQGIVVQPLRERHLLLILHLIRVRSKNVVCLSLGLAFTLAHTGRIDVHIVCFSDVSIILLMVIMVYRCCLMNPSCPLIVMVKTALCIALLDQDLVIISECRSFVRWLVCLAYATLLAARLLVLFS